MTAPRTDLPWRVAKPRVSVPALAGAVRLGRSTIHPITAAVLANRGHTTPASASAFFNISEGHSHNPFLMKGMRQASDRVYRAIKNGEQIVVFGDYDADGIPGTALLAIMLRRFGARVATHIPSREAGYGLSPAAAKEILERYSPKLVITVDCGSSDHDAINFLRSAKVDVVVTDHHLTLKGPPPTPYFINPSRSDGETYPYRGLCGCGVAYKLVQSLLANKPHEPYLYDLIAISTVGDQVPLTGENRFYVRAALARLNASAQGNLGLRALAKVSGTALNEIDAHKLAWRICPRINAVGRMGADTSMAVELLTTSDAARAAEVAQEMAKLNGDRQRLTDKLIEDAFAQIGTRPPDFIVAHLPDAPIGVAGLVAARIVEQFQRPTLVVNDQGRGSGRAPDGMEIMPFMEQFRRAGLFGQPRRLRDGQTVVPDYGGHAAACGFHHVDVAALRRAAASIKLPAGAVGAVTADCVAKLAEITPALAAELAQLGPFGIGNPEPAIVVTGLTVTEQAGSKDGRHLRLTLSDGNISIPAVMFSAGELAGKVPARVDVVCRPDMFGNSLSLQVAHLRKAS
jgi:single-stranded-DNA-specific exonuclease